MTGESSLPDARASFTAHFSDPIYEDVADEFAPFGSDEGWDLLHEWAERRDELRAGTTLAELIEESGFGDLAAEIVVQEDSGIPAPGGQIDAATIVVGAGFTLLRLSGRIDDAGRQHMLDALNVLIHRFGSVPALVRQRTDLESWRG